jgi:hypothetical protein
VAISGGTDGMRVVLMAESADRVVTVKNNAALIIGADFVLG